MQIEMNPWAVAILLIMLAVGVYALIRYSAYRIAKDFTNEGGFGHE